MMQDVRWVAWIISSLMYLFVMYSAGLIYMEALLQIFYIFIGLYGLYQWRFKADKKDALKITTWSVKNHLIVIGML